MSAVQGWKTFTASGAMNYPDAERKFVWDGRGTNGPSASCSFTEDTIRISPIKPFRFLLGWPELVLPREKIELVEQMLLRHYRFRVADPLLDGACFLPIGTRGQFLAGLDALGIPVVQTDWREKLRFERHTIWNQVRWGTLRRKA